MMGRRKKGGKESVHVSQHEPKATEIKASAPEYRIALIRALNWYALNYSAVQARNILASAFKQSGRDKTFCAAVTNLSNADTPLATAWCVRLMLNGAKFSKAETMGVAKRCDAFSRFIADLLNKETKVRVTKNDATVKPKTIQDYLREKVEGVLGDLEGSLDEEFSGKGTKNPSTLFGFFADKNLPAPQMKVIAEWAESKINEFGEVMKSKDPDIKEGWANVPRKVFNRVIVWLNEVKEQALKFKMHKITTRAPRRKKAKPPSVQVAKLKFLPKQPNLGLTSIDPALIVNAQQLWTFNTKTRIATVFHASGPAGLGVKGSRILGFDLEASEQKRLRKPDKDLKTILEGGKILLRKFMETLSTKGSIPRGRINVDTILLRVITA